ncbi:hypothetical protein HDU76_007097 [Blyttiomyces sp. JEL0837]|nr:hypothetical protein HDU76_007097 [Blyttiomyces sp. JEL0837]
MPVSFPPISTMSVASAFTDVDDDPVIVDRAVISIAKPDRIISFEPDVNMYRLVTAASTRPPTHQQPRVSVARKLATSPLPDDPSIIITEPFRWDDPQSPSTPRSRASSNRPSIVSRGSVASRNGLGHGLGSRTSSANTSRMATPSGGRSRAASDLPPTTTADITNNNNSDDINLPFFPTLPMSSNSASLGQQQVSPVIYFNTRQQQSRPRSQSDQPPRPTSSSR